jgi:hypothetical protein
MFRKSRARAQWVTTVLTASLACVCLHAQTDEAAAARHAGVQAVYPVMLKAVEAGDFDQARTLCEHAILMEPRDPMHRYNLACIESRAGGAMLPRALVALDQAVALGFNDLNSLQTDPDLAAIRGDAKFAAIVAKLGGNAPTATNKAPVAPPTLPGFDSVPAPINAAAAANAAPVPAAAKPAKAKPAARPAPGTASAAVEKPAVASYQDGIPVGLFFMTRYWFATRSLEKAAWYFAPDHTVYEHLETGFSKADLAAHRGRVGTGKLVGDSLEVTWRDGKKTLSKLERDKSGGLGFAWNGGLFGPAKPIANAQEIAGSYEGGESVSFSGSTSSVAKGLELRADGTFRRSGVASINSQTDASRVTAGSTSGSTGTWRAENYALILTDDAGQVFRGISFPYDDEKTPTKPDRLFFAGTMYKKLQ